MTTPRFDARERGAERVSHRPDRHDAAHRREPRPQDRAPRGDADGRVIGASICPIPLGLGYDYLGGYGETLVTIAARRVVSPVAVAFVTRAAPHMTGHPWERGRIARMDNHGAAPRCGRDGRAPRGRLRSQGTAALPGDGCSSRQVDKDCVFEPTGPAGSNLNSRGTHRMGTQGRYARRSSRPERAPSVVNTPDLRRQSCPCHAQAMPSNTGGDHIRVGRRGSPKA